MWYGRYIHFETKVFFKYRGKCKIKWWRHRKRVTLYRHWKYNEFLPFIMDKSKWIINIIILKNLLILLYILSPLEHFRLNLISINGIYLKLIAAGTYIKKVFLMGLYSVLKVFEATKDKIVQLCMVWFCANESNEYLNVQIIIYLYLYWYAILENKII